MTVFDEPKVDCHCHLLDPARFPYAAGVQYEPGAAEQSDARYLATLLDTYGVQHALVVGPNSGYDTDNRCLLDLLDSGRGRFKGVAVVANDTSRDELLQLRERGVVGTTMQMALLGVDAFRSAAPLLATLAELGMVVDVQVQGDQLVEAAPLFDGGGHVLIDHCGRPDPGRGLDQPGFRLLLDLATSDRYVVKLSGVLKASRLPYPYHDAWPYVHALVDAYGPDRCLWGSDWPFLRAPQRLDYGMLLRLIAELLPDPGVRRAVLWHTPCQLFGWDDG